MIGIVSGIRRAYRWDADCMHKFSTETFHTLSLLTPYDIDQTKFRVGNERDGAYIILDQPASNDILSFGISNDTSFEEAMAARGHRLFLYDHSIPNAPTVNKAFHFHRKGICGENSPGSDLLTLEQHMANISDLSPRLMLKIDVEGAEWDVFSTVGPDILSRFDQIVAEFHWFRNLNDENYARDLKRSLEVLNKDFTLYHVHANNCAPVLTVHGFCVADVIEVSYVRTSLVERRASATVYPSALNKANRPDFYDHPLLFYPFLPASADIAQIAAMVERVRGDYQPTPRT